jgi:hypothetical protein
MPNKRAAVVRHANAPETSAAITDANSKATDIFISGATGANARFINGHYKPTQERGPDGHVIYHMMAVIPSVSPCELSTCLTLKAFGN